MALENLTDQIKERFAELSSKIQESPTYNNLREKFETLTPTTQKGIIAGAAVVVALILFSFPYSDITSSSQQIEDFNVNRSLLRQLLRASRLASETATAPGTMSTAELRNQIQSRLGTFTLQPEQMVGIVDLDGKKVAGALATDTAGMQISALGVSLKKLNLKQVVDIAFDLQQINPSVKMAGVEVAAGTPDPHYFDVLFKLVVFGMPEAGPDDSGASGAESRVPPSRQESPDGESPVEENEAEE